MRSFLLLAPLLALVACGPSKEDFQEQSIQMSCDKLFECTPDAAEMMGYADADACVTDLTELVEEAETSDTGADSCANYDSGKAKECLDAMEALACDASEADMTAANEICEAVCPE
jgi:hypothetical protein